LLWAARTIVATITTTTTVRRRRKRRRRLSFTFSFSVFLLYIVAFFSYSFLFFSLSRALSLCVCVRAFVVFSFSPSLPLFSSFVSPYISSLSLLFVFLGKRKRERGRTAKQNRRIKVISTEREGERGRNDS